MEENAKTELELSEEQLQEITGGCALCGADQEQVIHHLTIAKAYTTISGTAAAKGKGTTLYDNLRQGHVTAAINLLDRILARGH
jgi:bacteriocin-like protein